MPLFPSRIFRLVILFLVPCLLTVHAGCRMRNPHRPLTAQIMQSGELSREGNAALAQGHLEEAEKKLGKAVQINQSEAELRRHYAEVLWARGKREESIEQLHEAAQASIPDAAQAAAIAASLASKLLEAGYCEDAITWSQNCIRLTPKDNRGWSIRGRAYARIGERFRSVGDERRANDAFAKARNDYYRALDSAPADERELLAELARIQQWMNQPEHALATWQNLQRLHPPEQAPSEVLIGKAEALLLLGRSAAAADCLANASLLAPGDFPLCLRRAETEILAGRFRQAEGTLRHAYRLAPDHPDWVRVNDRLRTAVANTGAMVY